MKQIVLTIICFLLSGVSCAFCDSGKCSSLSMQDCFSTRGCFLDCDLKSQMHCGSYRCREAKDQCESTYSQRELSKDKCLALNGCVYSEASCFCPEPMDCFCGGGPPAMCRSK